ncbi:MAG: HD domain-containing protein [Blautia faecis]
MYAAALLHDCGKHEQYEIGTPHEQASARIAPEILKACGFNDEETGVIVTAISRHRDPEAAKEKNLNGILYRADKASRACFACDAEKDCNWKDGKKNLTIKY